MSDQPEIGEVREFREHQPRPLRKHGYADNELLPFDILDPSDLRLDPIPVKRRWDGEFWRLV